MNTTNRTELGWGGGEFSVVLDLTCSVFRAYASEQSAVELHAFAGGANYYRSCSGLTGAGWIPTQPRFIKVGSYRVDLMQPELPSADGIFCPIDYRAGAIPNGWPVIRMQFGTRYCYAQQNVAGMLAFERGACSQTRFEHHAIRSTALDTVDAEDYVYHDGQVPAWALRRVSEAAKLPWLGWQESQESQEVFGLSFWRRLGVYPQGEKLFKITRTVCRAAGDLGDHEWLKHNSPKNVEWLSDRCYLQRVADPWGNNPNRVIAVAIAEDGSYDFEHDLRESEVAGALNGHTRQQLLDLMYNNIQHKVDVDYASKVEQEDRKKFMDFCESDAVITVQDALDAGCCEPGIRDFMYYNHIKTDAVPASALKTHILNPDVKRTLKYVFART